MRKLALAGLLSILATVALGGCMSVPAEEEIQAPVDETTSVAEETPAVEEAEEGGGGVADKSANCYSEEYINSSVSDKLANYEACSMDFVGNLDMISGCNAEAKALNEAMKKEEVKKLIVFSSDSITLDLYKTVNPDKLTKEEVKAIAEPCAELGAKQVLEVTEDYIIWGYPNCTAGAIPEPGLQPELYADWEKCTVVEKELHEYFELD